MRLAFVCNGRPDNLKYLKNNRDNVDKMLTQHAWDVVNIPLSNISEFNKILKEYEKNSIDEFLFFYTGHGDVSGRRNILMLPLDNIEVSIDTVLDSIYKYINPKKQAIILDACYSLTIKDLVPEKNMEFLSSSQAIEQSYEDGDLKSSIFSYYFCEAMGQNKMTLSEISSYIRSKDTRQTPLPMSVGSDFIKITKEHVKVESSLLTKNVQTFLKNLSKANAVPQMVITSATTNRLKYINEIKAKACKQYGRHIYHIALPTEDMTDEEYFEEIAYVFKIDENKVNRIRRELIRLIENSEDKVFILITDFENDKHLDNFARLMRAVLDKTSDKLRVITIGGEKLKNLKTNMGINSYFNYFEQHFV